MWTGQGLGTEGSKGECYWTVLGAVCYFAGQESGAEAEQGRGNMALGRARAEAGTEGRDKNGGYTT